MAERHTHFALGMAIGSRLASAVVESDQDRDVHVGGGALFETLASVYEQVAFRFRNDDGGLGAP